MSDPSEEQKQERCDELLVIMRKREAARLPRFKRLEVGWHWDRKVWRNTGDPDPAAVEWRDCLECIKV